MFKYLFKRDTILATLFVFVVMGLLALVPLNTHVLDPFKLALQDFDYNDIAYSRMDKNKDVPLDTNIVIVNIDTAGRKTISTYLQKLVTLKPKVIGVDILFNEAKDSVVDEELSNLFQQTPNMVLAYSLNAGEHAMMPESYFYECAKTNRGYVNFVGEEGGVIRYISPFIEEHEKEHFPFAAAVAKQANENRFKQFENRHNTTEIINYTLSEDKFLVLAGNELLASDFNGQTIANKVVLVGYVSPGATNIEDKHFTPMNKKFVGKSLPDLNGVFVHANIVKMILDKNYISRTPTWLNWLIAVLLCWLHTALFIRFYLDKHLWFHLAAKAAQLFSAILFVYIGLLFFDSFSIKINLTSTLVAIILAVDVLYFYEAFSVWLHKKAGYKTIFYKPHH